jgi:hypothetical protein
VILFAALIGAVAILGYNQIVSLLADNKIYKSERDKYIDKYHSAESEKEYCKQALAAVLNRPVIATLTNEQADKLTYAIGMYLQNTLVLKKEYTN